MDRNPSLRLACTGDVNEAVKRSAGRLPKPHTISPGFAAEARASCHWCAEVILPGKRAALMRSNGENVPLCGQCAALLGYRG